MDKINLNGCWKLYYDVETSDRPSSIEDVKKLNWRCIDAEVPGNVEIDLCRAGLEEDPFHGCNIYSFRKYEFYQWWFERSFEVSEELLDDVVILKICGLNTFGTIWINGNEVGRTANMLIEHEFDATDYIKKGSNQICIRIESALNKIRDMDFPVSIKGNEHHDEFVRLRMPPHSFGWDIAPRLLSAGIWRDIGLTGRSRTYIKEVYYAVPRIEEGNAGLLIKYRFVTNETYLDGFSVKVRGNCGDNVFACERKTLFCSGEMLVTVENARLWWPKGYGKADLYDVTFELLHNGKVVGSRKEKVGIRTVDIQTGYASLGTGSFGIHINSVPVLVKGTNWTALDALHSRDAKRSEDALMMLDDLGCNMVRCWGGNVYEDHDFFRFCDEKGIMVWQDFCLACGIYPQDEEFAGLIGNECVSIIKKLRNHPSLVIWSGDNEVDLLYYDSGYHLPSARKNRISREIIPQAVGSHDPFRHYLPSSPYIPEHLNGDREVPEQHCWGPRDYFKSKYYVDCPAAFISEIGFHGCPSPTSVRKFISPGKLWPYTDNDEWDTHNTDYIVTGSRHYDRNRLMADQVRIMFGYVPDDLVEFATASQISQAEAMKFFVESTRLKKWDRTGIIWWNLVDCWPQFSDAVTDYYMKRKLAYHYIKRAQHPVCVMISELENWEHKVIIGNDSNSDEFVSFSVEDGITGEVILKGNMVSAKNVNTRAGTIRSWEGNKRLYVIRWDISGRHYANHYISGQVPFELSTYKAWLDIIAALPEDFTDTLALEI